MPSGRRAEMGRIILMEFDQYRPQPEPAPDPPDRPLWPWAVALVVIFAGVVAWLLLPGGEPEPPPPLAGPAPEAAPPTAEAPADEPEELPRLAASDDWLRRAVA